MDTARRTAFGVDVTVRCSDQECAERPARYKIAAVWIGGGYRELKTYGFADDACLERVYRAAAARAARISLAEGEELGPLGVYELDFERRDRELVRRVDLEERCREA
jgi:hypothetical protein